jgi:hypothetical protein
VLVQTRQSDEGRAWWYTHLGLVVRALLGECRCRPLLLLRLLLLLLLRLLRLHPECEVALLQLLKGAQQLHDLVD